MAIAERTLQVVSGEQGLLNGAVRSASDSAMVFSFRGTESHFAFQSKCTLSIDKSVKADLLEEAVKHLMVHHDALRFCYHNHNGEWEQEYGSSQGEVIVEEVLEREGDIVRLITEIAEKHQRSLDIEKGELIRVVLIQTSAVEASNRLLIVIHHLGGRWGILADIIGRS